MGKTKRTVGFAVFFLVASAPVLMAGGQSSESYLITKDVLSTGGGHLGSDAYIADVTIGQQGVVGESLSLNFLVYHGFWAPIITSLATPTPGGSPTPATSATPTPTATAIVTPSPVATATPALGIKGDIDDDGRITTADALLCFQIALGLYSPTPEEEWRADADNDGRVTTADALCIFQEALGLPNDCFPGWRFH